MADKEDPEERIRELERPLTETARASESNSWQPAAQTYPPGTTGAPGPTPWTYGGAFPGPPPKRPSGNRVWWIVGAAFVIGVVALAGGIAAFAAHQISGVRSIISSPPTIHGTFGPPVSSPSSTGPSTSAVPPAGGKLSVSGINENRTIACNNSIVSVSGVSNTVMITGHCARLSVSGVQNSITVDAVDSIDASGFNNKVTYHSGTPAVSNAGDSNVVQQG